VWNEWRVWSRVVLVVVVTGSAVAVSRLGSVEAGFCCLGWVRLRSFSFSSQTVPRSGKHSKEKDKLDVVIGGILK